MAAYGCISITSPRTDRATLAALKHVVPVESVISQWEEAETQYESMGKYELSAQGSNFPSPTWGRGSIPPKPGERAGFQVVHLLSWPSKEGSCELGKYIFEQFKIRGTVREVRAIACSR